MFGDKIGTTGSVLQELCHIVIPPDINRYRISTGDVTHEFRTNRMVTDSERTPNGRLCPFCPVESFEHVVQNFPPDRTDINGHHRTRNGFTGLETDIKRIRPDTNG